MEKIRDSCVEHGVAPGTQTRSIPQAKFWRERGMRFLAAATKPGCCTSAPAKSCAS
ncbi:MAG TPA: hypothetical protein VEV17_09850 [Bryobacteraceae bacterium]|nr:hypothetical protein [Bryobacteraceae bacterium]